MGYVPMDFVSQRLIKPQRPARLGLPPIPKNTERVFENEMARPVLNQYGTDFSRISELSYQRPIQIPSAFCEEDSFYSIG